MKRYFHITLSLLAVMTLTACESLHYSNTGSPMRDINWTFWKSDKEKQQTDLVQTRVDIGSVTTPLPNAVGDVYGGSNYSSDPSVQVFDLGGGDVMPVAAVPAYGAPTNGMVLTGDSSVTVFSLDGAPAQMPMMDNGAYIPVGNQQAYYGSGANTQIFFKHGSSRLGGGDKRKLSSAADQAKFAPTNRVTVAGYASKPTQAGSHSVEGHVINLKQSMNRAFAVSRQLMRNGVPAEKLKTVSWGATKPTGNNGQDRRVDVVMGEQ